MLTLRSFRRRETWNEISNTLLSIERIKKHVGKFKSVLASFWSHHLSILFCPAGEDDLELLSLPPALKEKYIRLQTENRMLNKKLKDSEQNTATESMLEDAQSRVNELESEARYVCLCPEWSGVLFFEIINDGDWWGV